MKNMKRLLCVLMSLVLLTAVSGGVLAAFTDTAGHQYEDEIDYSRMKGYVTGFSETTFKPDDNITRAQLAVTWARFKLLKATNPNFTDLSKLTKYYDTAALLMYGLRIMNGTSESTFSPDDLITREQLISIAVRDKTGLAVPTAETEDVKVEDLYTDADKISDWAKQAVLSAVETGMLADLYDDETLQPQKQVTRAEVCKLIYNIDKPSHTVTVADMEGGTVTAEPKTARAGTTINLTITPAAGKSLKAGSLKANGTVISGTSFVMPKKDVLITAEFEDALSVKSIAIKTPPTDATYTAGETLDLTGLVIEATMSDDSKVEVTSGYSTEPAAGTALAVSDTTVTVTYNGKTATFDITVTEAEPPDGEPGDGEPGDGEPGDGEPGDGEPGDGE